MKKLLSFILLIVLTKVAIRAQGDLDDQQKVFYRNERTVAFSLNSNGFSFGYREGKRLDFLNKRIIDIELAVLKHPKELKLSNPFVQAGNSFVFGKLNNVFAIKAGIGHQKEIYKKKDLGGISIRYFYAGGPSIALSKPIYYNILYSVAGNSYELRPEKFNIDIHQPSDIYSRASFFKGFSEIGVTPGIFVRGGINFEYSKEDKVIHAIEIGVSAEGYLSKIPLMASDDNSALYLNLFVSYRIGYVIDPFNPDSNRIPSMFYRRQKQ